MQDRIYCTVLLHWKKSKNKFNVFPFNAKKLLWEKAITLSSNWGQRLLMENTAKMAKAQVRDNYETLIVLWFSSLKELDKN